MVCIYCRDYQEGVLVIGPETINTKSLAINPCLVFNPKLHANQSVNYCIHLLPRL
jgi:hypothetical protein